ncbi:MAG: hypothetical protein ISP71_01020 [Flavobacteriales bacterium]|nr:hypothetical protein [Flavobacteriales bacterium]
MKKLNLASFAFILLSIFFLLNTSCKKKKSVPNVFTYELNSQKVNCPAFAIGDRVISNQSIFWGRNDDVGQLELIIDTVRVGVFDQADYVNSLSGYSINFNDKNDNLYTYTKNSNSRFVINLKVSDGDEISGSFSATLHNIANNLDSVVIENGVFSFGI